MSAAVLLAGPPISLEQGVELLRAIAPTLLERPIVLREAGREVQPDMDGRSACWSGRWVDGDVELVASVSNGDGNPRWVPLWTLGYPAVRPRTSLGSNIGGREPRPDQPMRPPMRDIRWPVATGGGSWIRDDCAMLPPAEACARLRDRRDEIRTRFFNAMPSERDALRVEERGINARLDNDCGGR